MRTTVSFSLLATISLSSQMPLKMVSAEKDFRFFQVGEPSSQPSMQSSPPTFFSGPSSTPSSAPSISMVTSVPTIMIAATTNFPTGSPTQFPSSTPTTSNPTTLAPSSPPSLKPVTLNPSPSPSITDVSTSPTVRISSVPTLAISNTPSKMELPSTPPSIADISSNPTIQPLATLNPTIVSMNPTLSTHNPTNSPSFAPSLTGSSPPTLKPSFVPSSSPTTEMPSSLPSMLPSFDPCQDRIDFTNVGTDEEGLEADCNWFEIYDNACVDYGDWRDEGDLSANEACCICGGGVVGSMTPTDPTTPTPSQVPSVAPTPFHCGCETCTGQIWNFATGEGTSGTTCGDRVQWLMYTWDMPEEDACYRIAHDEFPDYCGACDPRHCGQVEDYKDHYHCDCITCNDDSWTTEADGSTCGDRIEWLQRTDGSNMGYLEACQTIGNNEFPTQCGGCDPTTCNSGATSYVFLLMTTTLIIFLSVVGL